MIPYAFVSAFGVFIDYPWIDIPFHFAGGVWTCLLFFFLLGNLFSGEFYSHKFERLKTLLLAVSFCAFIGVLWELHEFVLSEWFSFYLQQGISDTMGDFVMDILGGLFAGYFILFTVKK